VLLTQQCTPAAHNTTAHNSRSCKQWLNDPLHIPNKPQVVPTLMAPSWPRHPSASVCSATDIDAAHAPEHATTCSRRAIPIPQLPRKSGTPFHRPMQAALVRLVLPPPSSLHAGACRTLYGVPVHSSDPCDTSQLSTPLSASAAAHVRQPLHHGNCNTTEATASSNIV
jgi:hypothetical protein